MQDTLVRELHVELTRVLEREQDDDLRGKSDQQHHHHDADGICTITIAHSLAVRVSRPGLWICPEPEQSGLRPPASMQLTS